MRGRIFLPMNIQTPQLAVKALQSRGVSQRQIAAELRAAGVVTTQETISRIGSGSIKRPSFELGAALISLANESQVA